MDNSASASAAPLPPEWGDEVRRRLVPGEKVLSWFAPDLDVGLRYHEGLVVLTDRRVLACGPAGATDGAAWADWELTPGLTVQLRDRGGLESLELFGPDGRL